MTFWCGSGSGNADETFLSDLVGVLKVGDENRKTRIQIRRIHTKNVMDPEAQTNTWIRIRNTVKTPTGKIKKRKARDFERLFSATL
jgi:hypothetical protein